MIYGKNVLVINYIPLNEKRANRHIFQLEKYFDNKTAYELVITTYKELQAILRLFLMSMLIGINEKTLRNHYYVIIGHYLIWMILDILQHIVKICW